MALNLNHWLRKTPQPIAVLADDKRIEVGKNGRAWRDLTATVEAMDPSKLTCLDGQGNILRSINLESSDDKAAPVSPEISDVQLFAKLIAEAYEKSGHQFEPLLKAALDHVSFVSVRLAKAESEIEKLRAVNHKLNAQLIEASMQGGDETEGSIMGAFAAAALQAQNAAPDAPTPIKQGAKK